MTTDNPHSFGLRVERLKAYWTKVFGKGPTYETCLALSVFVLGTLYLIALLWMVPASIFLAFREPKD